jgi:hypothetical protein
MKTIIDLLDTSRTLIKDFKDDVELKIGEILITQVIQLLQKGYNINTNVDWDKIEINNHIDKDISYEDVYNLITEKNIENDNSE